MINNIQFYSTKIDKFKQTVTVSVYIIICTMFRLNQYRKAVENFIAYQYHHLIKYPTYITCYDITIADPTHLVNILKDNQKTLQNIVSEFPTVTGNDWDILGNAIVDNMVVETLLRKPHVGLKWADRLIPGSIHYKRVELCPSSKIKHTDVRNFVDEAGLNDLGIVWGSPGWQGYSTKGEFISGHKKVFASVKSEGSKKNSRVEDHDTSYVRYKSI